MIRSVHRKFLRAPKIPAFSPLYIMIFTALSDPCQPVWDRQVYADHLVSLAPIFIFSGGKQIGELWGRNPPEKSISRYVPDISVPPLILTYNHLYDIFLF